MKYYNIVFDAIKSWDKEKDAIIYNDVTYSYKELIERIFYFEKIIKQKIRKPAGSVVTIKSSMSFDAICLFFALCKCKCIIVPISKNSFNNFEYYYKTSNSDYVFDLSCDDISFSTKTGITTKHHYINNLRKNKKGGLIVFSSGSSGKAKGVVHDIDYIFEKFTKPRKKLRTLSFLLFDHLGGINTFIYVLSSGGCVIIPKNKSVATVLKSIENFKADLLPTSPSFLNLMLASELYKEYDLSSLKIISYGTEVMHEKILNKLNEVFENVDFQQTYGLTEIGVLRSKSLSNNSLWVKLGGKEFKTRVVAGKLQIKGKSTMLGYINADNPFTKDGWLKTGDSVEVQGEYYKILGRDTDIIIVGGQKVYPSEVENVILGMGDIKDVAVFPEKNILLGSIVCAKIVLKNTINYEKNLKLKIKNYCKDKMEKFKIPVKILIVDSLVSDRYKKLRR